MNADKIRIWRSPASKFGRHGYNLSESEDETLTALSVYTDDELQKIAQDGFNAIWVHGQLHHLIHEVIFPEFGKQAELHCSQVNELIRRAGRFGIRVYLYLQPPRAIRSDSSFWLKHPEVAGQDMETLGDDNIFFQVRSLCTSHPLVREYLRSAFAKLATTLSQIAGYIIISASEYPAHCYSRRNCQPNVEKKRQFKMPLVPAFCPRCSKLSPEMVVTTLLRDIRDGVRQSSETQQLIFWNWSWSMYCDPPCAEIINELPQDIFLLVDFERGGIREDGVFINEYSLSYAGPSQQFRETKTTADQRGIHCLAKLQLGTTHELATIVSLPVLNHIFRKARYIRETALPGFLGCWNFGNYRSANIVGFNYFLAENTPEDETAALTAFAKNYFPGCNPSLVAMAWSDFSNALKHLPFSVPFLYYSPLNYVLSFYSAPGPLSKGPVGRSWLPDLRGDDLGESITPEFPLPKIIRQLQLLADGWQNGLIRYRAGLAGVPNDNAILELGNAEIANGVWHAALYAYQIYQLRLKWSDDQLPRYRELARAELEILEPLLPFLERDSRQGYHIEAACHMFDATSVRQKCDHLRQVLDSVPVFSESIYQ